MPPGRKPPPPSARRSSTSSLLPPGVQRMVSSRVQNFPPRDHSRRLKTFLSLLRSSVRVSLYPRLTPWALLLRRFAAWGISPCCDREVLSQRRRARAPALPTQQPMPFLP